jgi:hypothetical protein
VTPEERAAERAELERQLEERTVEREALERKTRTARLEIAAATDFDYMRPEAIPAVVKLLPWDQIEDELDLAIELHDFLRENEYLCIPELLPRRYPGAADGGSRSAEPDEPITRRSAKRHLRDGHDPRMR